MQPSECARLLLLEIGPIWNRAASSQNELILQYRRATRLTCWHAATQLHRRLVEIRDCEMAGHASAWRLDARDRSVVERGEKP
ncbi:hypothetical protein [Arthrobacter sp. CG_A4]|uniref:hypothetical protein n=1 Tax=Arthrobacter sp. CG_A4 TaxID=3071706 RepID=UPI002E0793AD|nr:hypothetical protein [Arthrobacter sp. CG_A4]